MLRRRETILFFVAISALLLASLVYYLDRPSESVYLIPRWLPVVEYPYQLFGSAGGYLPAFLHPFIFILLTCACLTPSCKQLVLVCMAWFTINILFEVAQIEPIARWITTTLNNQLAGIPLLENIAPYFLAGVYDFKDVCAIAVGTITAYLAVLVITNKYAGELI